MKNPPSYRPHALHLPSEGVTYAAVSSKSLESYFLLLYVNIVHTETFLIQLDYANITRPLQCFTFFPNDV